MSELKPCPLCLQPLTPKTINGEVDHYIHPFSKCFLSSTVVFKEQIDLWNTRAPSIEAIAAVIAEQGTIGDAIAFIRAMDKDNG